MWKHKIILLLSISLLTAIHKIQRLNQCIIIRNATVWLPFLMRLTV
ncbi:hypothetical protein EVA_14577 [gut metagenome]|uniref:Uncharacterized protein n=1 Tax=gut metagenome TaxID=749906 RepID=J9FS39_9ZZZZ